MVRLNQKVKASSLVESVVAILIITISMGVAFLIFGNISQGDRIAEKVTTELLIEKVMSSETQAELLEEYRTDFNNITIVKTIDQSQDASSMVISYTATNTNGDILSQIQIIKAIP